MRVLFLTHSYPRWLGDAAGSFLLRLAQALRAEDVEVRVLAPGAEGLAAHDVVGGIPVERYRYAPRSWETLAYTGNMAEDVRRSWSARLALGGFLASGLASLLRARRAFSPDVVHAHWWFPAGLVAAGVAGRGRVPLVTTMHGSDVRLAVNTKVAHPAFRRVMRRSRVVTTVSTWLARQATDIAPGVSPVVAPMPAATELFFPSGPRDVRSLLFVGRLNAQKGIEALLEALALMRAPAALDVVGDGEARDALAARAAALGITERVRWHGALPQPALPELYRAASALVVPSVAEGLGLVAIEAQLCETPVVAYDSGGLRDIITSGTNGVLVPAENVAALAAALDDVVGDPAKAAALGRAGRETALARFSPEAAARRYAELYRAAAGK
jgi:glycosyltransferase involved in cell wall biosynthesis